MVRILPKYSGYAFFDILILKQVMSVLKFTKKTYKVLRVIYSNIFICYQVHSL